MSEQLSTVQQLWRDRRQEFEAYLRGEMTIHNKRGDELTCPLFDSSAISYTFRPLPKPPKLRPLTREEWIERRDWWMREKCRAEVRRIGVIGEQSIWPDGSLKCLFQKALEYWEMSPDLKTWHPCGVPESEVAE